MEGGDADESSARIVHLPNESGSTSIGCRRGRGGETMEYAHGVRTDAALVVLDERPHGVLEVSALQATVVEHEGTAIASAVDPEDFHLTVGA